MPGSRRNCALRRLGKADTDHPNRIRLRQLSGIQIPSPNDRNEGAERNGGFAPSLRPFQARFTDPECCRSFNMIERRGN
jgi:hypothetical protein